MNYFKKIIINESGVVGWVETHVSAHEVFGSIPENSQRDFLRW